MALTKINYNMDDLEERDIETAPSLDLPDLQLDYFFVSKGKENLMLFLTSTKARDIDFDCPYCKKKTTIIRAGRAKPRLVHDVMRVNMRVDIAILPQLYRCTECNQRFTLPISGIEEGRQMTTRLYNYLKKETFLQSHTDLVVRTGFSITTVQNVMDEQIEIFEEKRKRKPIKAPKVLGIDEKHIANRMRGTLVDVEKGDLIEMLKDHNSKSFINAIKSFEGWDKNIKIVTVDMNNSYIKWLVELLPDATIVIDRFHVIKDILKKVGKAQFDLYAHRMNLIMEIEDIEERQRQLNILRIVNSNRFLFRNSIDTIERDTGDKAEKLLTVILEFPEYEFLRVLYGMVEKMYKAETIEEAERLWDQWQMYLPPSGEKAYQDWCDTYGFGPTALRKNLCKFKNCDKNTLLSERLYSAAQIFYSIQWIL